MKYKINGEWKEISVKASDTLPIGTVVEYAGSKAPSNWLFAGTEVPIADYPELYEVIGDTFNDKNTPDGYFKVYNKKGLVTVGIDSNDTDFNIIGKNGGEKKHKLTNDEMPEHSHALPIQAGSEIVERQYNVSWIDNQQGNQGDKNSTGTRTGKTGGSQSHNNLQPYVVSNYIVKAKQSIAVVGKVLNEKSDSEKDTYSCDYINELNKYSTSSVKIGTDDDEKDIYRIVVKGTTPTQEGEWVSVKTLVKNLKIKEMHGTIGDYLPIPMHISDSYRVNFQYNSQSGNLFCMVNGYANSPFELTIKYKE